MQKLQCIKELQWQSIRSIFGPLNEVTVEVLKQEKPSFMFMARFIIMVFPQLLGNLVILFVQSVLNFVELLILFTEDCFFKVETYTLKVLEIHHCHFSSDLMALSSKTPQTVFKEAGRRIVVGFKQGFVDVLHQD